MEPTTQEALEIVTQLKAQADAQIASYQIVSDGHKIIMDRLNGIIETPAADYVALKEEKALVESNLKAKEAENNALQTAYDNALVEKDALITESVAKDTLIEELQAQVAPKEIAPAVTPPVGV